MKGGMFFGNSELGAMKRMDKKEKSFKKKLSNIDKKNHQKITFK